MSCFKLVITKTQFVQKYLQFFKHLKGKIKAILLYANKTLGNQNYVAAIEGTSVNSTLLNKNTELCKTK